LAGLAPVPERGVALPLKRPMLTNPLFTNVVE
jgi:hypothetical protein